MNNFFCTQFTYKKCVVILMDIVDFVDCDFVNNYFLEQKINKRISDIIFFVEEDMGTGEGGETIFGSASTLHIYLVFVENQSESETMEFNEVFPNVDGDTYNNILVVTENAMFI